MVFQDLYQTIPEAGSLITIIRHQNQTPLKDTIRVYVRLPLLNYSECGSNANRTKLLIKVVQKIALIQAEKIAFL